MELTGHYQTPSANPVVTIQLPHYISLILSILTGSAIIVMGVITAARREISNPFSDFNDLRGDTALQAALARGFTCEGNGSGSNQRVIADYCVQHNQDKLFSGIYVWILADKMDEMRFLIQENTLRLGDLVLLWGKPEMRMYCETVVASWPTEHMMSIISPFRSGAFTYLSPVSSVAFTRSGMPHYPRILMNDVLHNCQ